MDLENTRWWLESNEKGGLATRASGPDILSVDDHATTMQAEKGTLHYSLGAVERYPTIAISARGSESERTNPTPDGVGAYHGVPYLTLPISLLTISALYSLADWLAAVNTLGYLA